MFPIGDDNVRGSHPAFITWLLLILNVVIFLFEATLSEPALTRFIQEYGVIPAEIMSGQDLHTLLTSIFLHGGWLHLIGNMLYLWVFGDNVEDAMGHVRYPVFYLLCGAGAAALQVFVDQDSIVPMVGASGAIAGVLGAYLVLFPRATVSVVIPLLFFFGAFPVPAAVLIVFWFLLQLMSGVASLGTATGVSEGIAFWAHVGGFITGAALIFVFRSGRPRRRPPEQTVR